MTGLMLFFAAVLFLDGLVGDPGWLSNLRAERNARAEQQELDKQRAQNDKLRLEIKRMRTDPSAMEDTARRTLGVVKPGEKVFRIREVPSATTEKK
jgi:cell division protein FtsB